MQYKYKTSCYSVHQFLRDRGQKYCVTYRETDKETDTVKIEKNNEKCRESSPFQHSTYMNKIFKIVIQFKKLHQNIQRS